MASSLVQYTYLISAGLFVLSLKWMSQVKTARRGNWAGTAAMVLAVIGTLFVVVVPLILPMAAQYDINPYHLAVIFLLNLELGFLIPPVGMNLFVSSIRFGKSVTYVCRAVLPSLGILTVVLLIVTYVPWISTALPSLVKIEEEGVSLGGGYIRLNEDEEQPGAEEPMPEEPPPPEDDILADPPDGGSDGGTDAGAPEGKAEPEKAAEPEKVAEPKKKKATKKPAKRKAEAE